MTLIQSSRSDLTTAEVGTVELTIGGMTCAACANRVERALNKLDGVSASVNYATERAVVTGSGADLAERATAAVDRAGYDAAVRDPETDDDYAGRVSAQRVKSLRRRLVVATLLSIPLMDATIILGMLPSLRFPGWEVVCLAMAVPVVGWAAYPFHRATVRNLRHRAVSMDTLVSLGILVSFGWAVVSLLWPAAPGQGSVRWPFVGSVPLDTGSLYLDVAAGMTVFQLAGRYFETRSRRRAADVFGVLSRLASPIARVLRDGQETEVPTGEVVRGDLVVVRAGETLPVDGTVVEGVAALDTSVVTGEPVPRTVRPGDAVVGGTISTDGRLVLTATAVGARTQLAQMAAVAEQAQERKARIQHTVDRVITWFVPSVIAVAGAVAVGWVMSGAPLQQALSTGIAVLVIACPCALGLATPTALMVGIGRGAMLGILIKGQDALEASGVIDTIVLDKTGTLTTGEMSVDSVLLIGSLDEATILRYAASVEHASEHPIARAVERRAAIDAVEPSPVTDFELFPGLGAAGAVDGHRVLVGSSALLAAQGLQPMESPPDGAFVVVAVDGRPEGVLTLTDRIRPSAPQAIDALHRQGLRTVLLTGDTVTVAEAVARELAIDDVRAEVLPADKAAVIAALQTDGRRVAMVGDGINDAAALATADLGLALVTGTDIALKSADIVLVREHLLVVPEAIALARRTRQTIHRNLVWAFAYNLAAVPVAAAGLLNPLIAAAAMSLSSLLVTHNSLRLRDFGRQAEEPENPVTD
ncbi:heavy metal translocating P-type ATPase [Kribbella sp. NBC_00709]|uniref:heavy metal translocating P-type ATPase n=1 Tax=Kribbella sp. NBC_00709 TaxID=2975972 RepID=UPI002E2CD087|nr:heavy metal translocating P-type ATPase [Kribbella sp. NBC_00709]